MKTIKRSARALVVTNAYPSKANLYRNGFVHSRVRGYLEEGLEVEVFYNHQPIENPYNYEFGGVKVRVGNDQELERLVAARSYDVILVHFAEPSRIEPLRRAKVSVPIIVWIHGFEAEGWYRRWFNFIGSPELIGEALDKREWYYEPQNAFFRELVTDPELDVSFVNVSDWFQKMVVEPDIGTEIERSVTIPNFVDGQQFPYSPKREEHRLKILTIRPFASYKYANDLTVEAISELSSRPYFKELDFTICGEGRLFDSLTNRLRKFKNVNLVPRFLKQTEISQFHEKNGVFLAPTRFDSQGVSTCEAMSSGLVPVSTDIAAIPEFINHGSSGLLAPPEDPVAIADLVERLYFDPELFLSLSRSASRSIQIKCGREATIGREISTIMERVHANGR
ncbi:glycosyltransferase family 4 protein [Corynebacterium incognita]|uniref:Glycosyltransferase family 4 protein n=1 Tax=Corynebacterium incognita TaxID=2754725 RepID=A0A7G7CQU0_9CORY|nr:glycosyltransferase family 4 protein [Corynebacterium incognita]QNE89956.1 glycosyltransferase family 4 protein [Corynebacterium incognita]